jgi:hypothetical protein
MKQLHFRLAPFIRITGTVVLIALVSCLYAKPKSDEASIAIYPNPNMGHFTVSLQSPVVQKVSISIVNIMGQILRTDSQQLLTGANRFVYDMPTLNSGFYIVMVAGKDWNINEKILVQQEVPTRSDSLDIIHYDLSLTIRNLVHLRPFKA